MKHKSQEGDKMQQPSTKEILQFSLPELNYYLENL